MRVSWQTAVAASGMLATMMVMGTNAAAPEPTSMSVTVNPTQILPTGSATVTGAVVTTVGGVAVTCGHGQLQYDIVGDTDINGNPIGYLQLLGPTALSATGDFSATFDASVITKDVLGVPTALAAGDQIQLRAGYAPSGGGCDFFAVGPGQSPTTTLTIIAAPCLTPVSITADFATGVGLPPAGYEGDWSFRIVVSACEAVTKVTAQGGTSAWTDFTATGFIPDTGTAAIRKQNNKTTVILWTIGDMAANTQATMYVTVHGKVKPGTRSGTELFLSGPWSATFTDAALATLKSTYTGRVSVFVQ
jgi:hypothetical protein